MNQIKCKTHKWIQVTQTNSSGKLIGWMQCSLCGEMKEDNIRSYLIIGEECTDRFIYGTANRLSPEAPVPVFLPEDIAENRGMAGNVAENLKAILEKHENSSITYEYFCQAHMTKTRYVDRRSNHIFLRVDEKDKSERIKFNAELLRMIRAAQTIIISDYNKGFLEAEDIEKILSLAPTKSTVILDTKKILNNKILDKIDFVKLNESEFINNSEKIPTAIRLFKRKIIVTLGGKGAKHKDTLYEVSQKDTIDVSGAGDTFLAAFAYMYSVSSEIADSIKFANEMASLVVTKKGVSTI